MGMEKRAEIARLLMDGGRAPETPVLVVQWGTAPAERSVRVTLAELEGVHLGAPATIVVGAVAGLDLGGRPARPLAGVSVVVTRPRAQSGELVSGLAGAGADVIVLPVMAVAAPIDPGPLQSAAERAGDYAWIVFTSANAVDRFVSLLVAVDPDVANARIWQQPQESLDHPEAGAQDGHDRHLVAEAAPGRGLERGLDLDLLDR